MYCFDNCSFVVKTGKLDYIAKCPTGSAKYELEPGQQTESYDEKRIYESGMCNTPDGNHLSSEIQLACAPFQGVLEWLRKDEYQRDLEMDGLDGFRPPKESRSGFY